MKRIAAIALLLCPWASHPLAQSAAAQVEKVTTPLLVLHGEADLRVPTCQGREFYEALAAHGKTTRMVTYPGSGHFPSAWEQRHDVFREIADWLARYNAPPGPSDRAIIGR